MRSRLSILFLTVFMDLLGFGLVIPILPTYATQLGASSFEVGLVMAVYALMNFVFSPFWGTMSDRLGRRPVIAFTVLITALGFLLLANAHSLALLFAARMLAGIGSANIAASQAYITDVTPPEGRAKALGMIGAAFGLGFIFGPPVGGFIKEQYGMDAVGYTAMSLSLINLMLILILLPESLKEKDPNNKLELKPVTGAIKALRNDRFRDLFITTFIYIMAFSMMQITVALLWEQHYGLNEAHIGYMFAFIGLSSAIVQGGLVGWLSRTFGEPKLMVIGSVLCGTGLLLTPFVPYAYFVPLAFIPMLLLAFANGCMMPSISSLLSRNATNKEQGQVLGMNQSFGSLARIAGPTAGGFLYGLHFTGPYIAGALLMVGALLFVLAYQRAGRGRVVQ
ncbi:MAG TPA: MFS transporter [Flavobacteriales bacterium]|nr:MFS transporter [Flavobacteriales bacterium]MBK7103514.1 MFS transporter [Flavobacteriales bacterium]MBK7112426.1 MFS transporter [Flavobacteriales bacterium]MBK8707584.1 MFS transporter [Flavobacteriales bacterium]MBP8877578.1 MFS transporter [Flavobacteriales bacterium]